MTTPPADPPRAVSDGLLPVPPPLDGFAPEEFRARRDALRAACPDGLILLRGATEDEAIPPGVYRQNSAFFYLTGVETPGAFLVLLPENLTASMGLRDAPPHLREILFLPARNPVTETWTGPKLGPGSDTEAATGIEKVADAGSLWNALIGWLRRNPVCTLAAPYGEQAATTRDHALMQKIGALAPVTQFRDVTPALARQRVVKSPAEIERIERAITITVEGQREARHMIAAGAGKAEYEIEAAIFAAFRQRNAQLAFASIVGGGKNATVLHYEENHAVLQAGDLVVVDIGARAGHYCGDLTRTYPVGGAFSSRQRDIYALVLDAHERAVAGFHFGTDSLASLNQKCKEFLKDSPLRAPGTDGQEAAMDVFMPHRLSHHLGLDVHDLIATWDADAPLPAGSVITIEPGIYLPSEGIGVRIEDDYLVTETGLRHLGPPLEKAPEELEQTMLSSLGQKA